MANWYVSSVAYAAVAQWAASTAVSVGDIVRQLATPSVDNERCFVCTTAGTTGATEPTWVLTLAANTNDNGVIWKECTGNETYQAPGAWAAPGPRINTVSGTNCGARGGDTLFIASDHSESVSGTLTLSQNLAPATPAVTATNPLSYICVDSGPSSHVPPESSDVTAGAEVSSGTGSLGFAVKGSYVSGVQFNVGASSTGTVEFLANSNFSSFWQRLDNCGISIKSTGGSSRIRIHAANNTGAAEWNNVKVSFNNATQYIYTYNSTLRWRNSGDIFLAGSSVPSALFNVGQTNSILVDCQSLDLSGLGSGYLVDAVGGTPALGLPAIVSLKNCKLPLFPNYMLASSSGSSGGGADFPLLILQNCDSGAGTVHSVKQASNSLLDTTLVVVRTDGASDGATGYAWKVVKSSLLLSSQAFFECFPLAIWNTIVGSSVNVTIHGIVNSSTLPTNDQIWLAVDYLNSGSSVLTSEVSGGLADVLSPPVALSADTSSAWDSMATARANSTVYALGDIVRVASNPGRIFFCTTAGTSAASEPAGYATATDGGSVTDGTAVFRAGVRFSQTVSVTPQAIGFLTAYVRVGQPGGEFYVDPKLYT